MVGMGTRTMGMVRGVGLGKGEDEAVCAGEVGHTCRTGTVN